MLTFNDIWECSYMEQSGALHPFTAIWINLSTFSFTLCAHAFALIPDNLALVACISIGISIYFLVLGTSMTWKSHFCRTATGFPSGFPKILIYSFNANVSKKVTIPWQMINNISVKDISKTNRHTQPAHTPCPLDAISRAAETNPWRLAQPGKKLRSWKTC